MTDTSCSSVPQSKDNEITDSNSSLNYTGEEPNGEDRPLLSSASLRTSPSTSPSASQRKVFEPSYITLVAQGLERTVFFSLVGNLAYFLRLPPLCWEGSTIAYTPAIITAVSLMFDLVSGMVLNCFFGRRVVTVGAYLFYLAGHIWLLWITVSLMKEKDGDRVCLAIALPTPKCPDRPNPIPCRWTSRADCATSSGQVCGTSLMICLLVICSAAGIVHAGLLTTGGVQARKVSFCEKRFFQLYYLANNLGGLIATVPISYLQQANFVHSFSVTLGILLLSAVLFGIGQYVDRESPNQTTDDRIHQDSTEPNASNQKLSKWKENILFYLLLLIYQSAYGVVYPNFYLLQGLHMDVGLYRGNDVKCWRNTSIPLCNNNVLEPPKNVPGITSDEVPPASLMAANAIAVILCLILIYCILKKCRNISVKRLMIAGQMFLAFSLCLAAVVEYYRLHEIQRCGYFRQTLGNADYYAAKLTLFWQIPQYVLLGVSEVLVLVTGLEFVYHNAKESAKGICIRLFWFVAGCGRFIGLAFVELFIKKIPGVSTGSDIDCNKEYWVMLALSIVTLLGVLFIVLTRKNFDITIEGLKNRSRASGE